MKNLINYNPKSLKTFVKNTFVLPLLLNMTSSLPALAVEIKDMKPEYKDLTYDLNGIRGIISSDVRGLGDISYSMTCCLEMCQDTTILEDIKKFQKSLNDKIAELSLSTNYKLEMQQKLERDLFGPIYEQLTPLVTSFNLVAADIKKIFLEKQAYFVEYDTTNIQSKLNTFYSETFPKIFPKNIEACKDFLIPDIEEVRDLPEETRKENRKILNDIKKRMEEIKTVNTFGTVKKSIIGRDNEEHIYGINEEIMLYGLVFAPDFLPILTKQLPQIINFTGLNNPLKELSEIQDFYNKLKKEEVIQLDVKEREVNLKELHLKNALDMTEKRTTSTSGINPKATLLETFYILQHFYERDSYKTKWKNDVQSLVTTSYMRLSEQDKSCVTGLLGRTFLIYRDLFQYAVEHY